MAVSKPMTSVYKTLTDPELSGLLLRDFLIPTAVHR